MQNLSVKFGIALEGFQNSTQIFIPLQNLQINLKDSELFLKLLKLKTTIDRSLILK